MIHTCPVCNNVTCATGSNVEVSKFAKFCTCGGVEGLKAEIERLQMELDASCNAEEMRQVRFENERLKLNEFNPDWHCDLCIEHVREHIETAKMLEAAHAEIKRLQRRICDMRNAMQELAEPQSGDYATYHEIKQI